MQNSKKGLLPFRHGVPLSDDQRPKTLKEENMMREVPYASVVGSLMYAKAMPQRTFKSHLERMGVRLVHNSL